MLLYAVEATASRQDTLQVLDRCISLALSKIFHTYCIEITNEVRRHFQVLDVKKVIEIAKRDNIGTHTAADRLAEERIKTIGQLKQKHPGKSSRAFTTLKEVYNR